MLQCHHWANTVADHMACKGRCGCRTGSNQTKQKQTEVKGSLHSSNCCCSIVNSNSHDQAISRHSQPTRAERRILLQGRAVPRLRAVSLYQPLRPCSEARSPLPHSTIIATTQQQCLLQLRLLLWRLLLLLLLLLLLILL